MENTLRYIEDYFTGQLKDQERLAFEQRCETDPEFAREVGLYVNMRNALRQTYHNFKKKDFDSIYREESGRLKDRKITLPLYAAISAIAATVLLVALAYFYFDQPDPRKIATTYIEEHLSTLSVTMGAEQDSLALGVNAYNEGDYARAATIFRELVRYPAVRYNSIKYMGLVSLSTGEYDSAIFYFDELAAIDGMYANPGMFFKAVTLMKRSGENDVREAEEILRTVVRGKMAGHKEAARWLKELN